MNLHETALWSLLALSLAGIVEVSARPRETAGDFLRKCERGKGEDACPDQVAGWLAIENFANGPFCSGAPPKRLGELSKEEMKALAPTVVKWLRTHPRALDMDVDDAMVEALRALYACHR